MANVNIRVDDMVKNEVEHIFSELGLSISAATNAFYKQVVRSRGIPFELKLDPFYSEENLTRLRKSVVQMEATGGAVHEVQSDD